MLHKHVPVEKALPWRVSDMGPPPRSACLVLSPWPVKLLGSNTAYTVAHLQDSVLRA